MIRVPTENYCLALSFAEVENNRKWWVIWDAEITLARVEIVLVGVRGACDAAGVSAGDGYLSNLAPREMLSI